MDSKFIITSGAITILIIVVLSFIISFVGSVFITLTVGLTLYVSTNLASRTKSIGNYLKGYNPPKTRWCSKIEYDHILVPANVDESLERLYERVIREHVVTWYQELSQDEELLQEIRNVFRDLTSDVLLRLARVSIITN